MSTTPEKIVFHNAKDRDNAANEFGYSLGTSRTPADKLTKAENNIIIFKLSYLVVLQVTLTFALSFPFHELHVRSMQLYGKLIQCRCKSSKISLILLSGRRANLFSRINSLNK